ncbi:MAG: hypothetical protein ACOCYB_07025 [Alkalispirochaeta sp.]
MATAPVIAGTAPGDLLADSPVENLYVANTAIRDVTPLLRGRDLRMIQLNDIGSTSGNPVSGVEQLADLPFVDRISLYNTLLTDEAQVRATFDARPDIFVEYPDGSTNQP